MIDIAVFTLGALALLATPGPTNTLLATSGATRGVKASLPLLIGEAAGYVLAIFILRVAVGPLAAAEPMFGQILSGAVCLYLVYLSMRLWRNSSLPLDMAHPVTVATVFATTLLNPKAFVFAFTLLPAPGATSALPLLPWIAGLLGLIALCGGAWIIVGAALRSGSGSRQRLGHRGGAVVLFLLALLLGTRAAGIA